MEHKEVKREVRHFTSNFEARSNEESGVKTISGYASKYNVESQVLSHWFPILLSWWLFLHICFLSIRGLPYPILSYLSVFLLLVESWGN